MLITKLFIFDGVPIEEKTNTEVTSTSSTVIRCIEAKYWRDDAGKRREAWVDTAPEVDFGMFPIEKIMPP